MRTTEEFRRRMWGKKSMLEKAMNIIKKNGGITTLAELYAWLPFTAKAFKKAYPPDSEGYTQLMQAITYSKARIKTSIRGNLYRNKNNPTAQIALYKMICTPEEREALNSYKADITTNGKELRQEPLVVEIIDSRAQIELAKEQGEEQETDTIQE